VVVGIVVLSESLCIRAVYMYCTCNEWVDANLTDKIKFGYRSARGIACVCCELVCIATGLAVHVILHSQDYYYYLFYHHYSCVAHV
jgi:hypothetical protein